MNQHYLAENVCFVLSALLFIETRWLQVYPKCLSSLSKTYLTALIFTRLVTPGLKWGSSYLTTGHLGRSYFLMICGMNWFGFYCSLPINSKSYPNYQGSKSLSIFFSLSILFMDIYMVEFCLSRRNRLFLPEVQFTLPWSI